MVMNAQTQNYLYLYDLPRNEATSTRLATVLQQKTGIVLQRMPQIRRDLNRPFYSAIMTIPEEEKFSLACKEMRYFELADGKPSRALPFDNDLLGSNPQKIIDHNIFVRRIPKEMTPQQLEEHFQRYGDIKSLKISLSTDHKSRGYGFVCFQDPKSASNALDAEGESDNIQVIRYQPRDKRDFRKIYNNIYAKNFPLHFTEADVRAVFEPFGRIEQMMFATNDQGPYAFICFNSEDKNNREYGPLCAQQAVESLNGQAVVGGCHIPDNKKLYVKEALKRADRQAERIRETIKYKSSKKRCNLYVKGFPDTYTEEELRNLFAPYGEIESLKMHPPNQEKKLYAFVCFKKPDEASSAKEQITVNDKTLTINHYEIKEIRELQNEAQKDKHDFQQFRQANSHNAKWTDLANQEEMQYYLKMLLENMPQLLKQQQGGFRMQGNMGGPPQHHQRNFNNNRGQMRRGGSMGPPQHHQNPRGGSMQHMQNQQQMNNMQMGQQQNMMQSQQPQIQPQPQPAQLTIDQSYLQKCYQILPAVTVENPNYRSQVGTVIYEFIEHMIGSERAPKATGMLIDLPIEDIKLIMQDFALLQTRVQQASELIANQSGP